MPENIHERTIAAIEEAKSKLASEERFWLKAAVLCLTAAQEHLKADAEQREREAEEARARVDDARKLVAGVDRKQDDQTGGSNAR
jgi:hypothetical protein